MEIDARINAARPKVAAARKMISQLTPRNGDQRRKIQAAENLLNGVENFFLSHALKEQQPWRGFFQNPERLTGKMIEHDLNGDGSAS
jgi:hypothetical protein